jgi:recombination associated protein RdgC
MFKNLQLFRLENKNVSAVELENHLSKFAFQPCLGLEREKMGWVVPMEDGHNLVHDVQGQLLAQLCIEKKKVPGALVKRVLKQRESEYEQQNGHKMGRKQVKEMKETIIDDLLPKAFSTQSHLQVWIDTKNGWVGVNSSGYSGAEEAIKQIIHATPDFAIKFHATNRSPADCMREWLLTGEAPDGFTIDRDCELRSSTDEHPSVKYVRHNLDSEEVKNHLKEGKTPTRLAMTWNDRLSFVLTDKGEIKRINFLDTDDAAAKENDESFDAKFFLMASEFQNFIPALVMTLGGEQTE